MCGNLNLVNFLNLEEKTLSTGQRDKRKKTAKRTDKQRRKQTDKRTDRQTKKTNGIACHQE